ncbi:vesicle coat component [Gonapodya sp. JEL0774]|nr:vesicle coat component [Gonapodya sp. JEL0774]
MSSSRPSSSLSTGQPAREAAGLFGGPEVGDPFAPTKSVVNGGDPFKPTKVEIAQTPVISRLQAKQDQQKGPGSTSSIEGVQHRPLDLAQQVPGISHLHRNQSLSQQLANADPFASVGLGAPGDSLVPLSSPTEYPTRATKPPATVIPEQQRQRKSPQSSRMPPIETVETIAMKSDPLRKNEVPEARTGVFQGVPQHPAASEVKPVPSQLAKVDERAQESPNLSGTHVQQTKSPSTSPAPASPLATTTSNPTSISSTRPSSSLSTTAPSTSSFRTTLTQHQTSTLAGSVPAGRRSVSASEWSAETGESGGSGSGVSARSETTNGWAVDDGEGEWWDAGVGDQEELWGGPPSGVKDTPEKDEGVAYPDQVIPPHQLHSREGESTPTRSAMQHSSEADHSEMATNLFGSRAEARELPANPTPVPQYPPVHSTVSGGDFFEQWGTSSDNKEQRGMANSSTAHAVAPGQVALSGSDSHPVAPTDFFHSRGGTGEDLAGVDPEAGGEEWEVEEGESSSLNFMSLLEFNLVNFPQVPANEVHLQTLKDASTAETPATEVKQPSAIALPAGNERSTKVAVDTNSAPASSVSQPLWNSGQAFVSAYPGVDTSAKDFFDSFGARKESVSAKNWLNGEPLPIESGISSHPQDVVIDKSQPEDESHYLGSTASDPANWVYDPVTSMYHDAASGYYYYWDQSSQTYHTYYWKIGDDETGEWAYVGPYGSNLNGELDQGLNGQEGASGVETVHDLAETLGAGYNAGVSNRQMSLEYAQSPPNSDSNGPPANIGGTDDILAFFDDLAKKAAEGGAPVPESFINSEPLGVRMEDPNTPGADALAFLDSILQSANLEKDASSAEVEGGWMQVDSASYSKVLDPVVSGKGAGSTSRSHHLGSIKSDTQEIMTGTVLNNPSPHLGPGNENPVPARQEHGSSQSRAQTSSWESSANRLRSHIPLDLGQSSIMEEAAVQDVDISAVTTYSSPSHTGAAIVYQPIAPPETDELDELVAGAAADVAAASSTAYSFGAYSTPIVSAPSNTVPVSTVANGPAPSAAPVETYTHSSHHYYGHTMVSSSTPYSDSAPASTIATFGQSNINSVDVSDHDVRGYHTENSDVSKSYGHPSGDVSDPPTAYSDVGVNPLPPNGGYLSEYPYEGSAQVGNWGMQLDASPEDLGTRLPQQEIGARGNWSVLAPASQAYGPDSFPSSETPPPGGANPNTHRSFAATPSGSYSPAFQAVTHTVSTPISRTCPSCGRKNGQDANFCGACGTKLQEPSFTSTGIVVTSSHMIRPHSVQETSTKTYFGTSLSQSYSQALSGSMDTRNGSESPSPQPPLSASASRTPSAPLYGSQRFGDGSLAVGGALGTQPYGSPAGVRVSSPLRPPLEPPGINDPLQRHRPRPIISQGFGGKLVVSIPIRQSRYNASLGSMTEKVYPGSVTIRQVGDIIQKSGKALPEITDEVKWGGPVMRIKSKNRKKEALKILEDRLKVLEAQSQVEISERRRQIKLASTDHQDNIPYEQEMTARADDTILLWKVIKLAIEQDGLLFAPDFATRSPTAALTLVNLVTGTTLDSLMARGTLFDMVEASLMKGDRRAACDQLKSARMWAHAITLAGHIDPQTYRDVVVAMADEQFGEKSNRLEKESNQEVATDRPTLRALFRLFGGDGGNAVEGFLYPPTDTRPDLPSSHINCWRSIVALILANRMPGDSDALTALGDQLKVYGRQSAAQICYLLSPTTSLLSGIDSPGHRVVLAGVDHTDLRTRRFWEAPSTLHLSELVELAYTLHNNCGLAIGAIPHLQAYKVAHAWRLADLGQMEFSKQYCEAIEEVIGAYTKPSPYFHNRLIEPLRTLHERLSSSGAVSSAESKEGTSWLGRISKFDGWKSGLNKFLNSAVGVEGEPPKQMVSNGLGTSLPQTSQSAQVHSMADSTAEIGSQETYNAYSTYGGGYQPQPAHNGTVTASMVVGNSHHYGQYQAPVTEYSAPSFAAYGVPGYVESYEQTPQNFQPSEQYQSPVADYNSVPSSTFTAVATSNSFTPVDSSGREYSGIYHPNSDNLYTQSMPQSNVVSEPQWHQQQLTTNSPNFAETVVLNNQSQVEPTHGGGYSDLRTFSSYADHRNNGFAQSYSSNGYPPYGQQESTQENSIAPSYDMNNGYLRQEKSDATSPTVMNHAAVASGEASTRDSQYQTASAYSTGSSPGVEPKSDVSIMSNGGGETQCPDTTSTAPGPPSAQQIERPATTEPTAMKFSASTPATPSVNRRAETMDDDDLGFGNNSFKKKKEEKSTSGSEIQKEKEPEKTPTTPAKGGWLQYFLRGSSAKSSPAPVRADLGETRSLEWDEDLKRWVDKRNKNSVKQSKPEDIGPPPKATPPSQPPSAPPSAPPSSPSTRPPTRTDERGTDGVIAPSGPPSAPPSAFGTPAGGRRAGGKRRGGPKYVDGLAGSISSIPSTSTPNFLPIPTVNTFIGDSTGDGPVTTTVQPRIMKPQGNPRDSTYSTFDWSYYDRSGTNPVEAERTQGDQPMEHSQSATSSSTETEVVQTNIPDF